MAPYRVLVVDDSAFMRKLISDLIGHNSIFSVVATASTGKEALEMTKRHKPDVITMDLEMPEMNGLEALQLIMRIQPTPVIMLAGISEEVTRATISALQHGAFDFIRKPSKSNVVEDVGMQLQEKLLLAVQTFRRNAYSSVFDTTGVSKPPAAPKKASGSNKPEISKSQAPKVKVSGPSEIPGVQERHISPDVQTTRTARAGADKTPKETANLPMEKKAVVSSVLPVVKEQSGKFRDLVAVGTSTGGPRALYQLLTTLPEQFPAPVLVVQHMPPKFTKSLAQRLDTQCRLHVTEAVHGERVKSGIVYIAPGGYHMELDKDEGGFIIRLSDREPRNSHRPSVDVMFESLLPFKELRRHTVIMTGMGNDGTRGMKALTEQGIESAIAEAEETCVVFGMPRSAIEGGGAKTVLPVDQIGAHLIEAVNRSKV
ncbi:chemotaxis response regulator protein-glutamate methylesterase [Paenibacillus tarimensis]